MSGVTKVLSKVISWYNDKLVHHPMKTAMCTTPCIYGFGDWIC